MIFFLIIYSDIKMATAIFIINKTEIDILCHDNDYMKELKDSQIWLKQ